MAYTSIDDPTLYFNTKLYTGNGSTQSITGVGFQPDWVWIKSRSFAEEHILYDSVRGVTKDIRSNGTAVENTNSSSLTAFDSDGWTMGSFANINKNGSTFASWNWLAGGTASSNTDGSITSSVSANTTAGFSIVSYTGNGNDNDTAKVGHGLGVAPNMIMIKCRNNAGGWQTSSTSLGWNNVLQLNETNAQASGTYAFGQSGVTPTSTVFTVSATSGGNHTNTNNNTYIAYCFAEKKGYSKFGSYTGNGNASNNTFVYTGFKPAFVFVKRTNGTGNWWLADNKRNDAVGGNDIQRVLFPNLSNAEATDSAGYYDFFSNGFRVLSSSPELGGSGDSYIYMAFAESPFVSSTGIPTTAR
jgi:hypothetical protein